MRIDEKERQECRGFMKWVKERWDSNTQNTQQPACKSFETTHHNRRKILRWNGLKYNSQYEKESQVETEH